VNREQLYITSFSHLVGKAKNEVAETTRVALKSEEEILEETLRRREWTRVTLSDGRTFVLGEGFLNVEKPEEAGDGSCTLR